MKLKLNKNTVMQLSNDVEVVPQEQTMNIAGAAWTQYWQGCGQTILPKDAGAQAYCDETQGCYTDNCTVGCYTQAATCANTCDDATCVGCDDTVGCYTNRPRICEISNDGRNSCTC